MFQIICQSRFTVKVQFCTPVVHFENPMSSGHITLKISLVSFSFRRIAQNEVKSLTLIATEEYGFITLRKKKITIFIET